MSRSSNPAVRSALIDVAARLLTEEGPAAVTVRRVASEVGVSTMAVYTHFEGMEKLRRAVRQEGFARLDRHLAVVRTTPDPVADLTVSGWTYARSGLQNPHFYRAMFLTSPIDEADAVGGFPTFERFVELVGRCLAMGRFPTVDSAFSGAAQCWMFMHGAVTTAVSGGIAPTIIERLLPVLAETCYAGFGDDRSRAQASVRAGLHRAARFSREFAAATESS